LEKGLKANFSLAGRRAVVTGASRGIGAAIAEALVEAGAAVALLGRDAVALAAVHERLGARGTVVTQLADVALAPASHAALARATEQLGGLDILVNNAGVEQVCDSLNVTEALWDRILDTNLKGAFFCAQAAARLMSGGSIINICSLTSEVGVPGATAYTASKSGMAGMTRALAAEWAPRGIRVNGIGPGYFRTALTEGFYQDPAWEQAVLSRIPQGRFGRLEDLAGAAVFLCSDAAAYITGQVLYVDGGYLAAF
jgi:NAD(P)-dependent dehydrogenase (short-subunit alcohol dehydrogenase family)